MGEELYRDSAENSAEENSAIRRLTPKYAFTFKVFKDEDNKLFLLVTPPYGQNIVIPCKNYKTLENIIEKLQLCSEKEYIDGKSLSIETTSTIKAKIKNKWELNILGDNKAVINQIKKKKLEIYEKEKEMETSLTYDDDERYEKDSLKLEQELLKLEQELSEIEATQDICTIANIDEITIGGKPLETTRNVAKYLIEKATISKSPDGPIIDFNSQNYENEIQDYLLKNLYSMEINLSEEQKKALTNYKYEFFSHLNGLMRGKFEYLEKDYTPEKSIPKLVDNLLQLDAIAKALPKRDFAIMINRQGQGVGKQKEVGAENIYDSFVSFGTNTGTEMGGPPNTFYKRLLKKNDLAIPMDLLFSDALQISSTECEILTVPFSYVVSDYKKNNNHDYITMGNTKELSVSEIIKKRLEQLKQRQTHKLAQMEEGLDATNNSEKDKIQQMLVDINSSLQKVEQYQMSPTEEKMETSPLQYFDEIDNQISSENNSIHISSDYDMKQVFIGNTGDMYLVHDKTNNEEYYFKPAISKTGNERPYRAYIQEAAYHLQEIINPENSVKCNVSELGGMFGAIQQKIPIDNKATNDFKKYFDMGEGELSPDIINQIMDEYLVDLCLCNYDSHSRNFIIDKNGKLRGIDKEQSFRYLKEDSDCDMMFSTNYNEIYGENPPIYNILFDKMKQGEISCEYLKNLKNRASILSQYPDDQYKQIFEKYAYGKSKTSENADILLSSILNRKSDILHNVDLLYTQIYNEWDKNGNTQESVSTLEEDSKNIDPDELLSKTIEASIPNVRFSVLNNLIHKVKTKILSLGENLYEPRQ